MASEFCRILDKSNDYFFLSRFASTPARQSYFQELYEENLPKSELIVEAAKEFMLIVRDIICLKKK